MNSKIGTFNSRVELAHGGGGPAMRGLIERMFIPGFPQTDVGLQAMDDGAALRVGDRWLVVTTDSHVIHPVFFPGGDIGRLSIAGTVNDLAAMGCTEPLGLTCAVVMEEGFPLAELERIWRSIKGTCEEAGTTVVAGDTKVMGRGEVDGIVLNTTGVGWADHLVRDCGLTAGDNIIVSGSIGDHGLAIMATRASLALDTELESDVAPLGGLVRAVLDAGGGGVVAMKDATRGGLASALFEMGGKSGVGVVLDEPSIPVRDGVTAAAELLGIDPLHVANEGKVVIGVRPDATEAVLAALRAHPLGGNAALIGRCVTERPGSVVLDTGFGRRLLTELDGEPLPRIC